MIKVGILILSNTWGGAEESVFKIANYLDKNKFTVYLFVNDFLYEKYKSIPDINLVSLGPLESNKKIEKIISLIKLRVSLIKVIRDTKVDILHAQLENTILLLGVPYKKLSVPIIFTFRGTETQIYHNPKTFEQRVIRYILERLFNEGTARFTAVTSWLTKDFKKLYRDKIEVLYNGIAVNKFRALNVKRSDNSIMFVGRYIERKGIEELLKAAAKLPDFNFIFVGKGPLDSLINLPNTKDLGFVERDDLVGLYNQATICVFPSRFEAFGNVCLEAMSCGAPVIVTNTGFSEYVEHGVDGLIVEPGNVEQLKDSIVKLMKNSKLRNFLGKNARTKALKFDLRLAIKKYESFYEKAVVKQ